MTGELATPDKLPDAGAARVAVPAVLLPLVSKRPKGAAGAAAAGAEVGRARVVAARLLCTLPVISSSNLISSSMVSSGELLPDILRGESCVAKRGKLRAARAASSPSFTSNKTSVGSSAVNSAPAEQQNLGRGTWVLTAVPSRRAVAGTQQRRRGVTGDGQAIASANIQRRASRWRRGSRQARDAENAAAAQNRHR